MINVLVGDDCLDRCHFDLDTFEPVKEYGMDTGNGTDEVQLLLSDGTIIHVSTSEWGYVEVYKPKIVQAPHDGRNDGAAS